MTALVYLLQIISGLLWLVLGVYLFPRVLNSLSGKASRAVMLSMPIAFLGFLMAGFSLRWILWSSAAGHMDRMELVTWLGLYVLSAFLALWFLRCAWLTRKD